MAELPFSIEFVLSLNSNHFSDKRHKSTNGSIDTTCPFCGGKRKFNVNIQKNVARCNKGGSSCVINGDGKVTGYNSITLHAALNNMSYSDAYKDLMEKWGALSEEEKTAQPTFKKIEYTQKKEVVAPLGLRDAVYTRLLKVLTLSDAHKNDLLKRGLSEELIEKNGYKTVPVIGIQSFANFALEGDNSLSLLQKYQCGIAGFYDLDNTPKIVRRKNGYFVPVRTITGMISGYQIRYNNLPEDATEEQRETYHKYAWFSSSDKVDEGGCSVTGYENIHFAGNWWTQENGLNCPEYVCLTEGVLKADIASALSGQNFIGLVGVNNVSQLPEALTHIKNNGTKHIFICVDMDYLDKKEVKAALEHIIEIIENAELTYTMVEWELSLIHI